MSLRTKIDIACTVGFDNDLSDTGFERELSEMLDTMDHMKSATYTLAASAADVPVSFDDVVQGQFLYIEGTSDFSFRIDALANDLIPVRRMVNPASSNAPNVKAYFVSTLLFSALYLTNPSATDEVRIKVCIVGDLTALPVC